MLFESLLQHVYRFAPWGLQGADTAWHGGAKGPLSAPAGGGEVTVLDHVSLTINPGEFVAIVGPSGNGKATLLNMITGIDRPTRGEVLVTGEAVHTLGENQLARWRGRNVGVIFQFFQLLPTLTILENVMLPMDFCNVYKGRERKERALHLLELFEDHCRQLRFS